MIRPASGAWTGRLANPSASRGVYGSDESSPRSFGDVDTTCPRRKPSRDPGTPGAWCRSPVRHRNAPRATAAQKAVVGCPWPSPGGRNPSRRSDRGPVADSAAHYPRERLPAVVEQSTPQSDGPSPRNVRPTGTHAPAPETPTGSGTGSSGTAKKSTDTTLFTRFSRNVFQVWDGGLVRRTMYLLTLVSPISMPSLSSSP
jgi:hypothetical protein